MRDFARPVVRVLDGRVSVQLQTGVGPTGCSLDEREALRVARDMLDAVIEIMKARGDQ